MSSTGAALFYQWRAKTGRWEFQSEIVGSDRQSAALFGLNTALDGRRAVVGAAAFDVDLEL